MKLFEIHNKEPWPRWELDLPNKVYIVYDENNKEVSRYTFQHVWNSSPARDAAQEDVNKLKKALFKKREEEKKQTAEGKPLSSIEQEYLELDRKWLQYYQMLFPKDKSPSTLDKETQELYIQQLDNWSKRLENLSNSGVIRNSIIMRTYKFEN